MRPRENRLQKRECPWDHRQKPRRAEGKRKTGGTRRFWEIAIEVRGNVGGERRCSPVWSSSAPIEHNPSPITVKLSADIDRFIVVHLL